MVELIENEIMERSPKVSWNDIAGLEFAKKIIYEVIIWPTLRPDIFTGIRAPPRVHIIVLNFIGSALFRSSRYRKDLTW